MSPDTTVKAAALVAASTSKKFNRTNTLFSHGYGDEDQESCHYVDHGTCLADQQSCHYADQGICFANKVDQYNRLAEQYYQGWTQFTDEYINKKTGILNKKGRDDLKDLYKNNQKFRD